MRFLIVIAIVQIVISSSSLSKGAVLCRERHSFENEIDVEELDELWGE